jgi:hypothetical protein
MYGFLERTEVLRLRIEIVEGRSKRREDWVERAKRGYVVNGVNGWKRTVI